MEPGFALVGLAGLMASLSACGGTHCSYDKDCAADQVCSRFGSDCLKVLARQDDFTDLSTWTFFEPDGGSYHQATDAGALLLQTAPGSAHATGATRVFQPDGTGAIELVVRLRAQLGSSGRVGVGGFAGDPSAPSAQEFALVTGTTVKPSIDYEAALRFNEGPKFQLLRLADDAIVSNFSGGLTELLADHVSLSISAPDGGPAASLELVSLTVAQKQ